LGLIAAGQVLRELKNFMDECIKLNQETFQGDSPRSFIEYYLIIMQEKKFEKRSSFNVTYTIY